ncbi:MAG: sigma-70 family RNA polymerase sigma factor [Alcanivorax sp.]|uniref:sigma-70 family RNA polymerase sigma factor n=1 Tax=Alcanivorax sp. TaxID=1872427 RepID=UPI003DA737E3
MPDTNSAHHDTVRSLYSDHHDWLYAWLHRKLGCGHNAADITQDTFVRLLNSRDALFGIRNPRGFLATTARRLIIDRRRREVIEQTYLTELMAVAEEQGGHASPEQVWQAIEVLEAISRVLESVPARARQAFLLHYLEGMTQVAVAERLGVTSRTIRSDLVKVLVQCQQMSGGE